MKILVSACLMGECCKYSGGHNLSAAVADFVRGHEVMTVCPEVMGGLPVPRTPAEIVGGVVTTRDGDSVDREFRTGARLALEAALDFKPDVVILQPRSPSCGKGMIYDGSFSGKLVPGNGVFAGMMIEQGFRVITPDEIER